MSIKHTGQTPCPLRFPGGIPMKKSYLFVFMAGSLFCASTAFAIGCEYNLLDYFNANTKVQLKIKKIDGLEGLTIQWLPSLEGPRRQNEDDKDSTLPLIRRDDSEGGIGVNLRYIRRRYLPTKYLDVTLSDSNAPLQSIRLSETENVTGVIEVKPGSILVFGEDQVVNHMYLPMNAEFRTKTEILNIYVLEKGRFKNYQIRSKNGDYGQRFRIGTLPDGSLVAEDTGSGTVYQMSF